MGKWIEYLVIQSFFLESTNTYDWNQNVLYINGQWVFPYKVDFYISIGKPPTQDCLTKDPKGKIIYKFIHVD